MCGGEYRGEGEPTNNLELARPCLVFDIGFVRAEYEVLISTAALRDALDL